MSDERSDAELQRAAYGRASTALDRRRAEQAAAELARRADERSRAAETAGLGAEGAVEIGTGGGGDRPAAPARPAVRRGLLFVGLGIVALVAVGITARALMPQPSLQLFDRPISASEREIARSLESFDADADVRVVAADGGSTFFAALSARTGVEQLCIGIAEYGAITMVDCLPVAQFEAEGVTISIPPSAGTGDIRIGEGFAFSWGPTGDFELELLNGEE